MRKHGHYIIDKRLKFKNGLQRKFLLKIKQNSGKTWEYLANLMGVSSHTIMVDWLNEKTTLPEKRTKKLFSLYPFHNWQYIENKWIIKKLPRKWGQLLAGGHNKKKINYPKKDEYLAEFLGIVLGDGHLDRKEFNLSSDAIEREFVLYVKNLINKLFGLDSRMFLSYSNKNSLLLDTYSTELIKFLVKNSMKIGNKIDNGSSLPKWVFSNKKFAIGAIRGLFDTDGGIYGKQRGYNRAIIEFQTKSLYINKDTIKLLRLLDFKSSKSDNKNTGKLDTRIQNQDDVHKFFELVGSNNLKNIMRYKEFLKTGVVPSYKETGRLIKIYRENNKEQLEFVG